jgi:hypothetical protein
VELIGLVVGFVFISATAGFVGIVIGAFVWRLTKYHSRFRKHLVLTGATLPILCTTYLFFCRALLPGESLLGDISQPLPNGYSLQALGKMPDFAQINRGHSLSDPSVKLSECIGSLAVSGPLVVGRYSHPFGSSDPNPDEGYFSFDTSDATTHDYPTEAALEQTLGHPIHLVQTQFFQSDEPSYKRQQSINKLVFRTPPLLLIITYILCLLRFRRTKTNSGTTA